MKNLSQRLSSRSSAIRYVPVIAGLFLAYALYAVLTVPTKPMREPVQKPPTSTFAQTLAGQGIIEPSSENIAIGVPVGGVVLQVHVNVGDTVKKGQPLLTLDNRPLVASVEAAKIALADAEFRRQIYENLKGTSAQRKEELFIRRFAAQREAARLAELEAQLAQYTLTAPIDGKVLRSNIRVGEFASTGVLRDPLMVLGNVDPLHVRVQIDETQASRINPDAPASGSVRGTPNKPISLSFVRKEPLIIPKRSLSGDPGERADTRVLEVIYRLNNSPANISVGQQMDVFISASAP
ncbi:MAG: efflux RND transporter periplasmic adaptor subunit [Holosporales bacterium]|jgi:HlyD family secretion protein